jgi:hypothetical protein
MNAGRICEMVAHPAHAWRGSLAFAANTLTLGTVPSDTSIWTHLPCRAS